MIDPDDGAREEDQLGPRSARVRKSRVRTSRPNARPVPRRLGLLFAAGGLGLAVAACSTTPPAHNSSAETALVKAIHSNVLSKGTVHVVIRRHQKGKSNEILSGDIGSKSADESVVSGSATASIRVTPQASYFSGNSEGLIKLLSLSKKEAARVGDRWVENKAGSSEYKQLFQADTMASLPSSLLPGSSDAVKLTSSTAGGVAAKVLTWTESENSQTVSEQLFVPASGAPLPSRETTKLSTLDQTTVFSGWGEPLHVASPPASDVIAYADISG